MISVIVCSVNEQLARQVKRNIDDTIGVTWELVLINNAILKKSITQVYNLGASRARYDILCFVHEDVLFKTPGWGQIVHSLFESDPSLGLIGVAGSKYKSKTLSGWTTGVEAFDCCNIFHVSKDGAEKKISFNPDPSQKVQEVVVTDGVFMCVPREKWEKVRFDEELITGFHLYDIDFSFRMSRKHKVVVTMDIDIVHLTQGGDFGDHWLKYTTAWHNRYHQQLPAFTEDIVNTPHYVERSIRKFWLRRLQSEKISWKNKFKWIFRSDTLPDISSWPQVVAFFLFRILKKKKIAH